MTSMRRGFKMRSTSRFIHRAVFVPLAVVATAAFVAAGCGSGDSDSTSKSDSKSPPSKAGDWASPNGDFANTRVADSNINADNVADLKLLWKQPIYGSGQFGSMAAMPIIVDGIGYVQDLGSNVYAFELETGEQLWLRKYAEPAVGPNGVAVEDGSVYGLTPDSAFKLDADTGKEIWKKKLVTIKPGISEGSSVGFTLQPTVHDGKLYIGEAAKAGGGELITLDADNGEELWRFDTTDNPATDEIPSGGIWYQPAIDDEGGLYYGIANGYYSYKSAKSTQNERLYTDSVVKLDGDGNLDWYMQGVVNDFYDWDMQLPPMLATLDGRDVVISSGKMGYVYVTDADSGKLLWKQAVGMHNGHDSDSQKQLDGTLSLSPPFDVLPGPYGGTETPMAIDDGVIYAAVVNMAGHVKTQKDLANPILPVDFDKGTGELVALHLKDGTTKWKKELPSMPLGAMTVSNDLVFTTTFDGTVHAYSTANGEEVWTDDMKVGSNSPLTIAGDYLFTAAAFPQGEGQKPMFYVYKLGASEITPPASSKEDNTGSKTSGKGDTTKSTSARGAQQISVGIESGKLKFDSSTLEAKAGKVTFTFTNPDAIAHDFQIEQDGKNLGGTKLISNGESDSFTVTLKPGTYTYYCTPHRSVGMTGTLTVT